VQAQVLRESDSHAHDVPTAGGVRCGLEIQASDKLKSDCRQRRVITDVEVCERSGPLVVFVAGGFTIIICNQFTEQRSKRKTDVECRKKDTILEFLMLATRSGGRT
jgi:hypothetical protein